MTARAAEHGSEPSAASVPLARAPGYWATAEYHASIVAFLQRTDPAKYGEASAAPKKGVGMRHGGAAAARSTPAQAATLALAADAVQRAAMAIANASPGGLLPAESDATTYAATHPKNVWALEGRMRAEYREVELPLVGLTFRVKQRHWSHDQEGSAHGIELHSTGGLCWDGAVVLADFLTHPPAVIAAHSPVLARALGCGGWSWEGRTVVEVGCGAAPLPSFAAALCGARSVLATDGSAFCTQIAAGNAEHFARDHPVGLGGVIVCAVRVCELLWGHGDEARVLAQHGMPPAVDVVLCADGLYVLGNKGAWSALLRTLRALTGARGFALLTYTERGAGKQFAEFLTRARAAGFAACEVAGHLLHACSRQGSAARLEQHVGDTRLFCLSPTEPPPEIAVTALGARQ
ncbi:hypothetical protein KFE25_012603 [Diacronema lutheri]|uniref:Calmodulin-lysine N-methyltransferase n=1 Tax=Diacronema lutheri TaxID=2081491 RepID=A0A8J5XMH2_DIALT|nr:hypothetical protein KFE25_012603 [Diacronema lutheri]